MSASYKWSPTTLRMALFRQTPPRLRPILIILTASALAALFLGLILTVGVSWPNYSPYGGHPLEIVGPVLLGVGMGVGIVVLIGVTLDCGVRSSSDDYDYEKKHGFDETNWGSSKRPPRQTHHSKTSKSKVSDMAIGGLPSDLTITTCEMHTGGEPLRIVESGYPQLTGSTILEKRRNARDEHDQVRKFLMFEPRGHNDMFGAVLVKPDHAEADLATLFLHNEGYGTMCGHAVIALGRYAVDKGLVKSITEPETQVNIQCPCGLVKAYVQYKDGKSGAVRFHSVPAFAYKLNVELHVENYGRVKVDIGYGGAFYALLPAQDLGLNVRTSRIASIVDAATVVSDAVKAQVSIDHPESADLSYLFGVILTDGQDAYSEQPTSHICVFANREVDRSPCGSGVTARIAVQFARGKITTGQTRTFKSGSCGSAFQATVLTETQCAGLPAVVVEIAGHAYYHGKATFTLEEDDNLKEGFLLR